MLVVQTFELNSFCACAHSLEVAAKAFIVVNHLLGGQLLLFLWQTSSINNEAV